MKRFAEYPAGLLLLCLGIAAAGHAADEPHAAILIYHHVDRDTPRATSVSPEDFERHLDYLDAGGFSVVSLPEIVAAFRGRRPLPPRAVALTFDDAYTSVYTEALPRLARRGWPFTVFVATDAIDAGYGGYLDWDRLRAIERRGGTIGNHSASHDHLVRRRDGESERAWRRRVREDLERAQRRLEAELDSPLAMFAWPYGESDPVLEDIIRGLGWVGFGQQSGPAGPVYGLTNLPRFPVSAAYADLDSLGEKLRSRPLAAEPLAPSTRIVGPGGGPPLLTLRVSPGAWRRDGLVCYVGGQQAAILAWDGDVLSVRARGPLRPGRAKYNCTAPSTAEPGVFYWYSHLWLVREANGGWYRE